jgi:hypothetical protein
MSRVFALNNTQLQNDAPNVAFAHSQVQSTDYAVTCAWDTGTVQIVHHLQAAQHSVLDTVASDITSASRTNPKGNVTGLILTGFGAGSSVASGDPIPVVGDACPGNSDLGRPITNVEVVSSSDNAALSDRSFTPAPTALDGANVWRNGTSVYRRC